MIDWFLLESYFADRCTAAERAVVERWIAENPDHAYLAGRVRGALDSRAQRDRGSWDRPAAIDAVLARIGVQRADLRIPEQLQQDGDSPLMSEATHQAEGSVRRSLRRAGSLGRAYGQGWRTGLIPGFLALAGVAVLSWIFWMPTRPSHANVAGTYTTAVGQRATIHLTDGSHVTLAPGTTLVVPTDFGSRTRVVMLTGEAYFDVAANESMPFAVHSGNVRTDVLGTTFAVSRYAGDVSTRVAVTTGRVSVAAITDSGTTVRHPTVVLAAGMVGEVTDSTAIATAAGNMEEYTGWNNGQLVFYHTPIRRALATIERWYGYQFRVADSALLQRDLTATFDETNSADMLMTLKALLNVTMTLDGSVVTLQPRRTSHSHSRSDVQNSLLERRLAND